MLQNSQILLNKIFFSFSSRQFVNKIPNRFSFIYTKKKVLKLYVFVPQKSIGPTKQSHLTIEKNLYASYDSIYSPLIQFAIPDFLNIQRASFRYFLKYGLIEEFRKYNSIQNSDQTLEVFFYAEHYKFNRPKWTPKQAILKRKSYACQLFLPIQLSNHKNSEVQLQWVLVANLPLMTKHGHFIFNGCPRVLMNQMVRSPGVYFKKLVNLNKKTVYCADFIAQRGSWLRLQVDTQKGDIWAKLKKTPKIPILLFLRALGIKLPVLNQWLDYRKFCYSSQLQNAMKKSIKMNRFLSSGTLNINNEQNITQLQTLVKSLEKYMMPRPLKKKDKRGTVKTRKRRGWPTNLVETDFLALLELCKQLFPSQKFYEEKPEFLEPKLAQKFLFRKFLNPRTYDLSLLGRSKINKKLGLSIAPDYTQLTGQDVLAACLFLMNLLQGLVLPDDIDDLANRKIKPSGDLLQIQIAIGLIRLEKILREKLNQPNLEPDILTNLFTIKPINQSLREFFGTSPLSQLMDQTNALAELTHKRRLSSLGPGGINRENAGMSIRGIHPTHYGRICPIETPEGQNAGLVNSFTTYSNLNTKGFIETPFYKTYKGFILKNQDPLLFSSDQESQWVLAPGDIFLSPFSVLRKGLLPARQFKEFKRVSRKAINFTALSPIQMISVATSLIPFLEHDDGNRALMGSNMQRQSIATLRPSKPIVGTGLESRVISDVGHSLQVKISGFVSSVDGKEILIYSQENNITNSFQQKMTTRFLFKKQLFKTSKKFGLKISRLKTLNFDNEYKKLKKKNVLKWQTNFNITQLFLFQTQLFLNDFLGQFDVLTSFQNTPLKKKLSARSFFLMNLSSQPLFLLTYCKKNLSPVTLKVKGYSQKLEKLEKQEIFAYDKSTKNVQENVKIVKNKKQLLTCQTRQKNNFFWSKKKLHAKGWKSLNKWFEKYTQKHLDSRFVFFNFPLKNLKKVSTQSYSNFGISKYYKPCFYNVSILQKRKKKNFSSFFLPESKPEKFQPCNTKPVRNQFLCFSKNMFTKGEKRQNKKLLVLKKPFVSLKENGFSLYSQSFSMNSFSSGIKTRLNFFNFSFLKQKKLSFSQVGNYRQQLVNFKKNKFLKQNSIRPENTMPVFFNKYLASQKYNLNNYHRSNQGTYMIHRPIVYEGQWVEKGDILADSSTSVQGELAIGQNILVGYTPWEGYNFEDAVLISERVVYDDLYTSLHIERYEVEVRDTPFGLEQITNQVKGVLAEYSYLDSNGIAGIGTWVKEGDILVGKIAPTGQKNSNPYEKLLYAILGKETPKNRDTSLKVPRGVYGRVVHIEIVEKDTKKSPIQTKKTFSFSSPRKFKKYASLTNGSVSLITSKDKQQSKALIQNKKKRNEAKNVKTKSLHFMPSFFQNAKRRIEIKSLPNNSKLGFNLLSSEKTQMLKSKEINKIDFLNFHFLENTKEKLKKNFKIHESVLETKILKLKNSNFSFNMFQILKNRLIWFEKAKLAKSFRSFVSFKPRFYGVKKFVDFNLCSQSLVPFTVLPKKEMKSRAFTLKGNIPGWMFLPKIKTSNFSPKVKSFTTSNLVKPSFVFFPTVKIFLLKQKNWFPGKASSFTYGKSQASSFTYGKSQVETDLLYQRLKVGGWNFSSQRQNSDKAEKFFSLVQTKVKLINDNKKAKVTNLNSHSLKSVNLFEPFFTNQKIGLKKEKKYPFLKKKTQTKKVLRSEEHKFTGPLKVYVYVAEKRKLQVGDKIAGRHGNKGIISNILPRQDMPYVSDGTPLDIVLNPLGVPSRMNVGQIFECLLGLAGYYLKQNYKIQPFDEIYGSEASRSLVYSKLYEARVKSKQDWLFNPNFPGKTRLFDGRTGNCFEQPVTVGIAYILKLIHLVDDKIHARSTGPYSLVTQQPLRGRAKQGGQRVGEMEVWALEGFGAAYILQEILTVKSDDLQGRKEVMDCILKKKSMRFNYPESFKLLVCELRSLCLNMVVYKKS